MKNALIYYYHMNPQEFFQNGENYFFDVGNQKYELYAFHRPIEDLLPLYELDLLSLQLGYSYERIVLNRDRQIVTTIHGKMYVLLELSAMHTDALISYDDLLRWKEVPESQIFSALIRTNWLELWSSKVDYFEYQMSHFEKKYPLLLDSLPYFIGLAENAISYLRDTLNLEQDSHHLVLSHKRVECSMTLRDYYNPLKLVLDHSVRDVAEYLKSLFFHENIDEVGPYIAKLSFSEKEFRMLYARLLFPCFYFDLYEKIVNEDLDEQKILSITERISDYEYFLYCVYLNIQKKVIIPPVPWIVNQFSF